MTYDADDSVVRIASLRCPDGVSLQHDAERGRDLVRLYGRRHEDDSAARGHCQDGFAADDAAVQQQARYLTWLLVAIAVLLWLTVILGTYVNFPPYRATPPEGTTDLSRYPRSLI
ncbi:MAG: hypothetical protein ACRDGR_04145, partial [bacterium]